MPIPTSKPITLSTVQGEYGGSNPISMSEYRGKGNAPVSGPIDLWGDFNGTSDIATIEIRVYGAAGGDFFTSPLSSGGYTQFIASVAPGTTFNLYAGGRGGPGGDQTGAGGGACSYVTVGSTLIAVAGGAGGGFNTSAAGGGGNNAGLPSPYGGSAGVGGAANNTNARFFAQAGLDWTSGTSPGYGGSGGASGGSTNGLGGENTSGKGYGGTGQSGNATGDAGGHGGGGGYGGGGGGCIENSSGSGEMGGGGGGFLITSGFPAGITGVSGGGTTGANNGHGYIEVYRNGQLATTVTATVRTGASGSYTV